jgi:hypothetical protein
MTTLEAVCAPITKPYVIMVILAKVAGRRI